MGVAACGNDDEQAASSTAEPQVAESDSKIDIAEFLYEPEDVTVAAGTRVAWTNRDTAPHTATARDESFDTGTLDQRELGHVTLVEPGTYDYYCRFHQFMNATIIVE